MSSTSSTPSLGRASSQRLPLFVAQPLLNVDGLPKIKRVFIANRGEIACRVIATCRKLNLTSIAIYVQEDKSSRHFVDADEAIDLGCIEGAATNPFLDIELLVRKAVEAGAHAVHPGYGYLSENPDLADRVREAGLIFLGPSSLAMSTLGNKRTSKEYLSKNAPEIPLIPGFSGTSHNLQDMEAAAKAIGFPVMLKASAGGGGKGMRIVRDPSTLRGELERAQSEAKRSFGSDDCILEKYIEAGKHVEIQIIGDSHGRVVSLWDRDCSVQRRHQKVIEEAPCSWLSDDMRKQMSESAVRIAELISYEGAGTVEFVVDVVAKKYYFLEVNARLQVEHPITEEITGVDLVSLQLYVATGGRLVDLEPLKSVALNGHAIECRLCAEDAHRDFFPQHGPVRVWQPAPDILGPGRDIRYETAIREGSQVSIYFDPMIAKLIVWAPNRTQAIEKMIKILANTACVGVRTNQLFLQSCLSHPAFRDTAYTTSFIGKNLETLLQNPHSVDPTALYRSLGATASLYLRSLQHNSRTAFRNVRMGFRNQRFDPINRSVNFVIGFAEGVAKEEAQEQASLIIAETVGNDSRHYKVYISKVPQPEPSEENKQSVANAVTAKYNAISAAVRTGSWKDTSPQRILLEETMMLRHTSDWHTDLVTASIEGKKVRAICSIESHRNDAAPSEEGRGTLLYAHIPALGTWVEYRVYSNLTFAESMRGDAAAAIEGGLQVVKAPMPCKVLRVLKKVGDTVEKGENVMVIESMKMEMSITAPDDGEFGTIRADGEAVDEGAVLCQVS
ncbi:carbamoyl-phosphate synthase L chain, ATP binding domain-containing protein [Dendryphion nanum]|uniref:Carbamoyl-phosphate synthase L chain, ATP binding domain-containing protein n=1 Tax=Dendryphion nanum TaxID=256645 RepID=A0A9P9DTJ5_9PLEO|nr:carbamoyl-phosphate synthase L chain, ATP binding domain-containing protein [Dendryphion nanum]